MGPQRNRRGEERNVMTKDLDKVNGIKNERNTLSPKKNKIVSEFFAFFFHKCLNFLENFIKFKYI